MTEALITKFVNDNVASARGPAIAKSKQNKANVVAAISAVVLEDKTVSKAATESMVKYADFKIGLF